MIYKITLINTGQDQGGKNNCPRTYSRGSHSKHVYLYTVILLLKRARSFHLCLSQTKTLRGHNESNVED